MTSKREILKKMEDFMSEQDKVNNMLLMQSDNEWLMDITERFIAYYKYQMDVLETYNNTDLKLKRTKTLLNQLELLNEMSAQVLRNNMKEKE